MNETYEQVKKTIIDVMARTDDEAAEMVTTITPETNLQTDLNADSLDLVEIVQEIEDRFDVTISDDDAAGMTTVGQAAAAIEKFVAAKA